MKLGERIKQLRKEKGWSQDELGEKIGGDGRQISRYENERITPSVEAIVKLAQVFVVSTDYLLLEEAPRQTLKAENSSLLNRLEEIDRLSEQDRTSLLHILDALVLKSRLKSMTTNLS